MVQAAHTRAEGLQRDNLSLRSQLNLLTDQLKAESGDADTTGRTPEVTPGGSVSSRFCMSGSSGQSAGGEAPFNGAVGADGAKDMAKMKALRSGESMDARSQKSDHLTGDEMDMLGGQKGSSSPSLSGSGRENSPIKPRNDSAQRLNRFAASFMQSYKCDTLSFSSDQSWFRLASTPAFLDASARSEYFWMIMAHAHKV